MTTVLRLNRARRAARILRRGGVVAWATETVWGLGADAGNAAAVAHLYALKNRDTNKNIVHAWGVTPPAPPRRGGVGEIISPTLLNRGVTVVLSDDMAIRCPQNALSQKILRRIAPVALTSANISGQPPLATWQEVLKTFGPIADANEIDFAVVVSRRPRLGVPSTIVKIGADGKLEILRQGAQTVDL